MFLIRKRGVYKQILRYRLVIVFISLPILGYLILHSIPPSLLSHVSKHVLLFFIMCILFFFKLGFLLRYMSLVWAHGNTVTIII
jgi:hypothetical protein